jgi:hypothetical protein
MGLQRTIKYSPMKSIRKSPFMDPMYSLLMAVAAFMGLAAFLNLKEKEEKTSDREVPAQKSVLKFSSFNFNYSKMRFGFIMILFFLLFLEDDNE